MEEIPAQGANQKEVIIFFSGDEIEEGALISFLAKVFQAIKIDLQQDTCFINMVLIQSLNLAAMLQKYKAKSIILFGLEPPQLGIQFQLPPYALIEHQGVQYLRVDDLKAIYDERQNGGKKMSGQLWKAIQKLPLK
jgi:hypothetical protein